MQGARGAWLQAHLDGRVCFGGVVALLPGDAPGGAALTLVAEAHAPLLGLLDDLQEGTRCPAETTVQISFEDEQTFPRQRGQTCVPAVYTRGADVLYRKWRLTCAQRAQGPPVPACGGQKGEQSAVGRKGQRSKGGQWDVAQTSSTQQEGNNAVKTKAPMLMLMRSLSLCPDVDVSQTDRL